MSIAHNFPDIDLSAIVNDSDVDENDENKFSVHFSSSLETPDSGGNAIFPKVTPKPQPKATIFDRTIGTFDTTDVFLSSGSGDIVIRDATTMRVDNEPTTPKTPPERSANSTAIEFEDENEEFEFFDNDEMANHENEESVLRGIQVALDVGCCEDARRDVAEELRRMGAEVVSEVTATTTHVIVDRHATRQVIADALNAPQALHLVDVQWVQECAINKKKVDETAFSHIDCHFLTTTLRRVSSAFSRRTSERYEGVQNKSASLDQQSFANEQHGDSLAHKLSAEELLDRIQQMSKKLDDIAHDYRMQPISALPWVHHDVACPRNPLVADVPQTVRRRQRNTVARGRRKQTAADGFVAALDKLFPAPRPTVRRRSHGGFVLAHRQPDDFALDIMREMKDVRDVLQVEDNKKNQRVEVKTSTINDMRKVTDTNLNRIRNTLKRNADISSKRAKAKPKVVTPRRNKSPLVKSQDTELESAFASLNIRQGYPNQAARVPLNPTRSSLLNRLQCSDDFLSPPIEVTPPSKDRIVLTGFDKETTNKLRCLAEALNFHVTKVVDEQTRCVVSKKGMRTLHVLKAVCRMVPIVKGAWLEDSVQENKALPLRGYVFDEWAEVVEKRKADCAIFENVGPIFIAKDCNPGHDDLKWMVKMSGGKTTKHIDRAQLIVVPKEHSHHEFDNLQNIVEPLFIIESITTNKMEKISDYRPIYKI